MGLIRAASLLSICCCTALILALSQSPAEAAGRNLALQWCQSEAQEFGRQFGPEGRRAWRDGNRSIRACTEARYQVVKPMERGVVSEVIAFHLSVVATCGTEYQADPEAFLERYKAGTTPYGQCVEVRGAEVSGAAPVTKADTRGARLVCQGERRAWARRGHADTWRTERGSPARCTRDLSPGLAARRVGGSGDAAHQLLNLRIELLEECIAALRKGSYDKVAPPSRTRLGTCVRIREEARRAPGALGPGKSHDAIALNPSEGLAAVAVLLAWLLGLFVLLRRRDLRSLGWGLHAAFSLPLAAACAAAIGSDVLDTTDSYDLASRMKNVAVPVAGVAFAGVVGLTFSRFRTLRRHPGDLLVGALAVLVLVAAVIGLARGNPLEGLLQDLGLSLLFIGGYAAGRLDPPKPQVDTATALTLALLAVVAVVTFTSAPFTPFYGLPLAVSFAAVAGVLLRVIPWPWLILAALTIGTIVYDSRLGGVVPSSIYLQVATGAVAVAYWLTRRLVPSWAWGATLAVAAIVALVATDARSIVTARYDGEDLSFAQRAFEARAVRGDLKESPVRIAVGAGLGATVDLSSSPDVQTLQAVRGDASEVDDVHLLPYDVLRRHGLAGLAWLGCLAALCLWLAAGVRRTRDPIDVLLFLVVAVGAADALPAASHLFANPLAGFALGALVLRLSLGRSDRESAA